MARDRAARARDLCRGDDEVVRLEEGTDVAVGQQPCVTGVSEPLEAVVLDRADRIDVAEAGRRAGDAAPRPSPARGTSNDELRPTHVMEHAQAADEVELAPAERQRCRISFDERGVRRRALASCGKQLGRAVDADDLADVRRNRVGERPVPHRRPARASLLPNGASNRCTRPARSARASCSATRSPTVSDTDHVRRARGAASLARTRSRRRSYPRCARAPRRGSRRRAASRACRRRARRGLDRNGVHGDRADDPAPLTVDEDIGSSHVPPEAVGVADRDDPDPPRAIGDVPPPVASALAEQRAFYLCDLGFPAQRRTQVVGGGIAAERRDPV